MNARRVVLLSSLILAAATITGCSRDDEAVPKEKGQTEIPVVAPRKITIAAITDFHGALEPVKALSADGKTVLAGGAANLAAHVSALRASISGPFLLLDGGDLFQGTMESNLFEGSPVIRLYNYLGVAAAALGNHEFDFGPVGEKAVPRTPEDDPRGALKERAAEATFPILAANVVDENGNTPTWARASTLKVVDGVKVGLIGASTMKTPSTTNRLNLGGLTFTDPVPAIVREAAILRSQGAEVLVLTMHEGGGCDDNHLDRQDDLSSCTIKDVFEIVQSLPEGTLDVVVAGHTHRGVAKRIGRTVILQAFSSGQYLAWAEVDLSASRAKPEAKGLAEVCGNVLAYQIGSETRRTCDGYRLKKLKGELEAATFLGKEIAPDVEASRLIEKELSEVKELKNKPLEVTALTPFTGSYGEESALGNLVADATKASFDGASIGLANGGGLRAPLPARALRYGDIFSVLPFDNQLAVMQVNGEEIRRMIELGISGKQGALLWSGLSFYAKGCEVVEANVGGEALSPVRVYSLATSDFLALGGSGLNAIGVPESRVQIYWDRPFILRDLVAGALPAWKNLSSEDFYNRSAPRQRREGKCGG